MIKNVTHTHTHTLIGTASTKEPLKDQMTTKEPTTAKQSSVDLVVVVIPLILIIVLLILIIIVIVIIVLVYRARK